MKKALRSGRVNEEALLEVVFIGGLRVSIEFSMHTYWGTHIDAAVQRLAQYASPLIKAKQGSDSESTPSRNTRYDKHRTRTCSRRSEKILIMSIQARRGSKSSLSSSKSSSNSRYSSLKQDSGK